MGVSLTTEQSSFSIVTLPVVQGADTSVKKPLNSATVGARPSNVGCVLVPHRVEGINEPSRDVVDLHLAPIPAPR